jgi:hypothetical protein
MIADPGPGASDKQQSNAESDIGCNAAGDGRQGGLEVGFGNETAHPRRKGGRNIGSKDPLRPGTGRLIVTSPQSLVHPGLLGCRVSPAAASGITVRRKVHRTTTSDTPRGDIVPGPGKADRRGLPQAKRKRAQRGSMAAREPTMSQFSNSGDAATGAGGAA